LMSGLTCHMGLDAAVGLTRRGDWGMCVRFWDENTRETEASVRQQPSARAFHPKARSHAPITSPSGIDETTLESLRSPNRRARSRIRLAACVGYLTQRNKGGGLAQAPSRGTSAESDTRRALRVQPIKAVRIGISQRFNRYVQIKEHQS